MEYPHELPFACKWIINKDFLKSNCLTSVLSSYPEDTTKFVFSTKPLFRISFSISTTASVKCFKDSHIIYFETKFYYSSCSWKRIALSITVNDSSLKHQTKMGNSSGVSIQFNIPIIKWLNDCENDKIEFKVCGVCHYDGDDEFKLPFRIRGSSSQEFSIVVKNKPIKIDRFDFKRISPVFAAMIDSGMKESIENKLVIIEFSFEIVESVIEFYKGKLMCQSFIINNFYSLWEFADYYQMEILHEYLNRCLTIDEENFTQIFQIATKFNSKLLRKRSFYFVLETSVKPEILEILDDEMKEDIKKLFITNYKEICT